MLSMGFGHGGPFFPLKSLYSSSNFLPLWFPFLKQKYQNHLPVPRLLRFSSGYSCSSNLLFFLSLLDPSQSWEHLLLMCKPASRPLFNCVLPWALAALLVSNLPFNHIFWTMPCALPFLDVCRVHYFVLLLPLFECECRVPLSLAL